MKRALLSLLLVAAAAGVGPGTPVQASVLRAVDWQMYGYDLGHTGFNPDEHLLGPGNVMKLVKAWTFTDATYASPPPTVVDGVVYVGSFDNNLYAVDAVTGTRLWAFPTGGSIVNSTAAVHRGVVYVGSTDDRLYAIDAATGTERWSVLTIGDVRSSPMIDGGALYVGSGDVGAVDGALYKINPSTGDVIWTAPTPAPIFEAPAISDGLVYVGSDNQRLYAFDSATGRKRWWAELNGRPLNSPVVANGVVYESTIVSPYTMGALYAFDAATGRRMWRRKVANGYGQSVASGVVYYSSSARHLVSARDAVTGAIIWTKPLPDNFPVTKPTVANGLVYFGAWFNRVYAVDAATGATEWIGLSSPDPEGEPTVVNGRVYVTCFGGDITAFRLSR